jgi:transcriptional regulator with XRE-family HTH domain
MAKNFKALQAKMSPEARARFENKANQMIREMALDELRGALDLTQQHLAELLHVNQAAISKVERRSDMYIGTLRKIIEAMGGQLDIRAILPGGIVRINQFEEIRRPTRAGPSPARGEASKRSADLRL